MNAISGTRRGMKELVDGTVRVTIDIDPQHRQTFFKMFARIDMPVALAPLVADFEQPKPETDAKIVEAATERAKGGELAKLAGILCADPTFQEWLSERRPAEWFACGTTFEGEEIAAAVVRYLCVIPSRAELDHNAEAAERFHRLIRIPYNAFVSGK